MITLKIIGECISCGKETDGETINLHEGQKIRYDNIEKTAKNLLCPECFLKNKFGLSGDLAKEILESGQ